jgi:hypothetical protein
MTLHLFLTHLAVWLALFIAYQLVAFHTPLLMLVLCGYGVFHFHALTHPLPPLLGRVPHQLLSRPDGW